MKVELKMKDGTTQTYENVVICEPKEVVDLVDGEEQCVGSALYIETEEDGIGGGKRIMDTEFSDYEVIDEKEADAAER